MSVLKKIEGPLHESEVMFFCPGCQSGHVVWVNNKNHLGAIWKFNGDFDRPTFEPSILIQSAIRCHSFVKDGKIQFLSDCTHELAGKTVALQDFVQQI